MAGAAKTLPSRLRSLGPLALWVVSGAVVVLLILLGLNGAISGLFDSGGGHRHAAARGGLVEAGSSWITGQPSLAASGAFLALEGRAIALADGRWHARLALIARIKAERLAARKAARARLLALLRKRYEEARRRALARYRAALRANALKRAEQQRKLAAARRKYAEALAAYRAKLRVGPGRECRVAEVRKYFNCHTGRLPVAGGKHG